MSAANDVRADAIAAVKAQAFDTGKDCPECGGSGTAYPGRRIIHVRGDFTGAEWDEAHVVKALEKATEVVWVDDLLGHNLAAEVDGKWWRFQVVRDGAR